MSEFHANMNLEITLDLTAETEQAARELRAALISYLHRAGKVIPGITYVDVNIVYEGLEDA